MGPRSAWCLTELSRGIEQLEPSGRFKTYVARRSPGQRQWPVRPPPLPLYKIPGLITHTNG